MAVRPRARKAAIAGRVFAAGFALSLALAGLISTPAQARSHHHRSWHGGGDNGPGLTNPEKDAALVIDGETGKVLYARNASELRHPASLTKMMTLYLLFEQIQKGQMTLATQLPISAHASVQEPTKLYLQPGDSIPVDIAIKAIVVHSANDVAVAIAEAIGGTESRFAEMMTEKAHELGMRNTFYHNASGLPDMRQITTATDLAILARHLAYDYPQFFRYFATSEFYYRGGHYVGHDNLLGSYDGADGIKTGYTEASGFNLVSSVVRDGTHVIGVVMGGRSAHKRDTEMVRLLDDTFARASANPRLIARANLPWQAIAAGPSANPVIAGFQLASAGDTARQSLAPRPALRGSSTDPNDEDAAESASDDDAADGNSSDNVIAPAAKPKPATVLASYHPQPPPAVAPSARDKAMGASRPSDVLSSAATALGIRDWTIQIGAFADAGSARAQLAAYAERSMDVLGQAQRIIAPFQSVEGQTLYRARFGPFVEREAREICTRLTERGQTCFAATALR